MTASLRIILLHLLLPVGLCTAAMPTPATLTDEEADSIERSLGLDEVVVTGTRTPRLLKDTPIATRLITSAEIRRSDATDLHDLLQSELPGAEFSYAMNQQPSLNLSGFAGQSVLILVDGERLAGETIDNIDFSRINMNGVSRVEVVKGPQSAIYGSNAAGGVVNIIRSEPDRPWRVMLDGKVADHGTWRAGADVGVKIGRVTNQLDFAHTASNGYDVCLNPNDMCDWRRVPAQQTYSFEDRITYRPVDALALSARAGYFFRERHYDPEAPDRYRDFTFGLKGKWQIDAGSDLEIAYAFDQYDKSDLLLALGKDVRDYRNVQNSVRALYNKRFNPQWLLTAGTDLIHDWLQTYQFTDGGSRSRTSGSLFAQADWNLSAQWELIGALRYDRVGNASHLSAKASASRRLGRFTLRGGYGGGYRVPSLKEMYMDFDMGGIFDIHGNQNLKPESSNSLHLSGEYTHGCYNATLGASYTFLTDKIATSGIRYTADGGNPYVDYVNVGRLDVASVDAAVQAVWPCGVSARLAYAYVHEQTRSEASLNQYCPARPHSLNIRGVWNRAWSRSYATELVLSGRFYSAVSYNSTIMYAPFETIEVKNPAYTLWRVALSQHVCGRVRINLAVDNIFNYAPAVYTLNAPVTLGASFQAGISLDLGPTTKRR